VRRGSHPHNSLHRFPRRLVVENLTKPLQAGRVRSQMFVRGLEGAAAELTQEPVAGPATAGMAESQPGLSTESTPSRLTPWSPAARDSKE